MSPYPGALAPVSSTVVELDSTINPLDMRRPARRISIYRGPYDWNNAHCSGNVAGAVTVSNSLGELSLGDRS